MTSLLNKIKTYIKQHKTQPELDERYTVDWVNFQKTVPPVRFWERVRGRVNRAVGFTLFIMFITVCTYLMIVAAETSANRQYCNILQDGGIQVIEKWHPKCD